MSNRKGKASVRRLALYWCECMALRYGAGHADQALAKALEAKAWGHGAKPNRNDISMGATHAYAPLKGRDTYSPSDPHDGIDLVVEYERRTTMEERVETLRRYLGLPDTAKVSKRRVQSGRKAVERREE